MFGAKDSQSDDYEEDYSSSLGGEPIGSQYEKYSTDRLEMLSTEDSQNSESIKGNSSNAGENILSNIIAETPKLFERENDTDSSEDSNELNAPENDKLIQIKLNQSKNNEENQVETNDINQDEINEPSQDEINEPSQDEINEPNHNKINELSHNEINEPSQDEINEPNQDEINEPNHNKINEPNHNKINEPNHNKINEPNHNKINEQNHNKINEQNHNEINEPNHDEINQNEADKLNQDESNEVNRNESNKFNQDESNKVNQNKSNKVNQNESNKANQNESNKVNQAKSHKVGMIENKGEVSQQLNIPETANDDSSFTSNSLNFNNVFTSPSPNKYDCESLEPKLPPLNNLKTYNPSVQSPRPLPKSPRSINSPRILPPPQRRQSPNVRRRQLMTPKNNNSYRLNYDFVRPDPLTDEENRLIKRIMKGETINFDPNDPNSLKMINNLIINLQELRKQKAIEKKYEEGQNLNKAISALEKQRKELLVKINQIKSMKQLDENYAKFKKRQEIFDNETKEKINELQQKQKDKKEEMKKSHETKEQDLLNTWSSSKRLSMFNRCSNELTSLRRQHAFLLTQNRFEEAQRLGNEIQQKQNYELLNNHNEHQKAYDNAYDNLDEKNKEEDEFFENKCANEMATLIQKRNKERRSLDNKERWFSRKKTEINDPEKMMAKVSLDASSRSGAYRKPLLPSSKMSRKELGDTDVVIYKLPPIVNRKDQKKKTNNNKLKPKM